LILPGGEREQQLEKLLAGDRRELEILRSTPQPPNLLTLIVPSARPEYGAIGARELTGVIERLASR
jgi:hypothetical protein